MIPDFTPLVWLAVLGLVALVTAIPYTLYRIGSWALSACWSCL